MSGFVLFYLFTWLINQPFSFTAEHCSLGFAGGTQRILRSTVFLPASIPSTSSRHHTMRDLANICNVTETLLQDSVTLQCPERKGLYLLGMQHLRDP